MRGVFHNGDRLTVHPCSFDLIIPGDIVVFNLGEQDIVHRVVEKRDRELVTGGDSNPRLDHDIVLPDRFIGKVSGVNRNGKEISLRHGKRGLRVWRRHQRFWLTLFSINKVINLFFPPGSLSWIFRIQPFLLKLKNPDFYKIIYKKKVIGSFNPTDYSFHLSKPWSLFVSRRFINNCLRNKKEYKSSR